MTILSVLSTLEQKQFDSPPEFNINQRNKYFLDYDPDIVNGLHKSNYKIGFILQFGYFKANGKFYTPNQFKEKDIEYVTKLLNLQSEEINFDTYHTRILYDHKISILTSLDWKRFDQAEEILLINHITTYVEQQLLPKEIFMLAINFFWQNKIELPSCAKLSLIITSCYNQYEATLFEKIDKLLDGKQKESLLLLVKSEFKNKPRMFKPRISSLKKINQSLNPKDIEDNVKNFKVIQEYFNEFKLIIENLGLTDQATEYFATWVQKATTFQLGSFANQNKLCIYLLSYIKNQYYLRQDMLIDIFLKSVKSTTNKVDLKIDYNYKINMNLHNKSMVNLSKSHKTSRKLIESIKQIIKSTNLSKEEKSDEIEKLINEYYCSNSKKKIQQLIDIEDMLHKVDKDGDYFEVLESLSKRLQTRASPIIKNIDFDQVTSDFEIIKAIDYFKTATNIESPALPTGFLKKNEKESLYRGLNYILINNISDNTLKARDIGFKLYGKNLICQVGNKISIIIKKSTIENPTIADPLYHKIIELLDSLEKSKDLHTDSSKLDLDPQEKNEIFNFMLNNNIAIYKQEKLRISLYKAIFFIHIAEFIKAGKLNLRYSYRYKSIKEYLIDDKTWATEKNALLVNANLSQFSNYYKVSEFLEKKLDEKYRQTNNNFITEQNKHLHIANDVVKIKTPKTAYEESKYISSLLVETGYVPILKILTDINQTTNFTDAFKHLSVKHKKMKPDYQSILACLIAIGCNIGINSIASSSIGVTEDQLSNIVNWCFSLKNITNANNKILNVLNKLPLADSFRASKSKLHTSSDGKKVAVSVDSLNSNYSFKYFGKQKGSTIYTFIDERNLLFYGTAISSSEREAGYVIDGLLANDVIKSDIHSTDTHGFTEIIFAISHFLGISFAPRIKKIGKQKIYSMKFSRQFYKDKSYQILPSREIKQSQISNQWDDVLRVMATIKLKHTSASLLLKRLSSYALDNPLYKALKEFGRIIKSIFILTYFDDLELRQKIEKQLNKIESSNKFGRAVYFARNQEFKDGTKEEQDISVNCMMLIQNIIVLWNYLFLSKLLLQIEDDQKKKQMAESIKHGSVVCWQHINFHGEYDFTKVFSNETLFDIDKIMSLET